MKLWLLMLWHGFFKTELHLEDFQQLENWGCKPWLHTCMKKERRERGHVQFKVMRWKVRETHQRRRMISWLALILTLLPPGNLASIFCSIKRVIQATCHPQFPSLSIPLYSPSLILSVCTNETKSFISSANCVYAQVMPLEWLQEFLSQTHLSFHSLDPHIIPV